MIRGLRDGNFDPTSATYLLGHSVVFLIGVVLTTIGRPLSEALKFGLPVSIGASLMAAGAAGWVLFIYVITTESYTEGVRELLNDFGFQTGFKYRGENKQEYESRVNNAKKKIDIMGHGLRKFREDQHENFASWAERYEVRVLLLDPEYPEEGRTFAEQRDLEEGDEPGSIETDVRQFVESASDLLSDSESNFDVRLYQTLPSMTIFRIDGEMIWGPYTIKEPSRNMPAFIVGNHGYIFNYLEGYFDEIWYSDEFSREVPEEWYQ